MPDYLAPGVYVEEVSFRKKPIEGVGTSTAGIVGPTPTGPTDPTPMTSMSEYEQVFGAGKAHADTFLPYAVRGFFENGGRKLYVARVMPADGADAYRASDFVGSVDDANQTGTGLSGLARIGDISLITIPDAVNEDLLVDAADREALVEAQLRHCEDLRYRFAILNVPAGSKDGRAIRPNVDFSRAAVYFPWILVDTFGAGSPVLVPPSGHVAGIYARTDNARGVHKAPANEALRGLAQSPGLEFDISSAEQALLNELQINAIRHFPGRGVRVWGARTLSSDPEWKYVNVRRTFLFLEQSIDEGTQWVVFEPNAEKLWNEVRQLIEGFLEDQWRNGVMQGASPKEAFSVRCDRSTMTQNDLDNGRLVCLVGVAPVKPAEFVIFRIGQRTADAE